MTPAIQTQQILLKSHPDADSYPTDDNFQIVADSLQHVQLGPQDVLIKLVYLSVDPYVRAMMSGESHLPVYQLGNVSLFRIEHARYSTAWRCLQSRSYDLRGNAASRHFIYSSCSLFESCCSAILTMRSLCLCRTE